MLLVLSIVPPSGACIPSSDVCAFRKGVEKTNVENSKRRAEHRIRASGDEANIPEFLPVIEGAEYPRELLQ
jgi:hypothetical protein